jgi:hypothetical protein
LLEQMTFLARKESFPTRINADDHGKRASIRVDPCQMFFCSAFGKGSIAQADTVRRVPGGSLGQPRGSRSPEAAIAPRHGGA